MGLTDHSVRIYDVVTKELKSDVINEDSSVLCMCLDTNNRLIIGTVDKTITVWDLKEGKKIYNMSKHLSMITAVALERNYGYIVSTSFDARVKIWDTTRGQMMHSISTHTSVNCLIALEQGGFVYGSYDSTIEVWLPHEMPLLHPLGIPYELVFSLRGRGHVVRSMCQVGKVLVSCDHNHALNVWCMEEEQLIESHFVHTDSVNGVALVPGRSKTVATVSSDMSICITALNDHFELHEPAPFDYESLWAHPNPNHKPNPNSDGRILIDVRLL